MEGKEILILKWRSYVIQVDFTKSYSRAFEEVYGYPMSHVEIRTVEPDLAPLPVSDTGYRSIFITLPKIENLGGVKTMITDYLDDAARNKSWKEQEEKARQYDLF